jgi:hypothetical protein
MDLKDLKIKVKLNSKIPSDSYSLVGGLPNEALCINNNGKQWEVYYSERGNKTNLKIFNSENDACEYFYNSLLKMLGLE